MGTVRLRVVREHFAQPLRVACGQHYRFYHSGTRVSGTLIYVKGFKARTALEGQNDFIRATFCDALRHLSALPPVASPGAQERVADCSSLIFEGEPRRNHPDSGSLVDSVARDTAGAAVRG